MNTNTIRIICDADKRNKLIAKYGEKNIEFLDIEIAAPVPPRTATTGYQLQ